MSYSEQEFKEICSKPVRIEPTAYQKMLMHVLRFGSPGLPKEQWRECYGMCVGKFSKSKDKVITITDVVPTTHGSDIGVEFVEENYILMAQFQDELDKINADIDNPDDMLFIVGWYHSHPGMERFLSSVDVRNQIAYQTSAFPFGVAIVFDNTQVFEKDPVTGELDFGFKIFRLDDPTSTEINIPYSEVPFERDMLNKPELIDLLKTEMQMIENIQKRGPFIKEYKETPSIFGMFKIPTTKELQDVPSSVTGEDRVDINILPLSELDQVFTTGMQTFIEKYQELSDDERKDFQKFIDDGVYPLMKNMLNILVDTLNNWTRKLRIDVDKRINFGISALNTIKKSMLENQDKFLEYLKKKAEDSQENNRELVKKIDELEIKLKKLIREYVGNYKEILSSFIDGMKLYIKEARSQLEQSELGKILSDLNELKGLISGSKQPAVKGDDGAGSGNLNEIIDALSQHLQRLNEIYTAAQESRDSQDAPPLLGTYTLPTTNEINDLNHYIGEDDDVSKDLLEIKDIAANFKEGIKEFITFYDGLSSENKTNFQEINEKGIQPLSDKTITNLVKGINQWTIQLRDDVDKRVNLLISVINEMQRTMKNIQDDYVEFLSTSTDPALRMQNALEKHLIELENTALRTFNSVLEYLGEIMEHLIYNYRANLEKQNQLLDQKELKKISKTLEQIRKSIK
ncbi:MAG: hypothetical protein ACTSVI_15630 [Promethearchaeota archaeon]